MKVTITHLKAPWPAGSAIGDIVDLQGVDNLPGWAIGKCAPASDDAEAAHAWQPAAPVVEAAAPVLDPDQAKIDAALLDAAQQEAQELRQRLTKAEAAVGARDAELARLTGELASVTQRLTEAEAAVAAKTKASKG